MLTLLVCGSHTGLFFFFFERKFYKVFPLISAWMAPSFRFQLKFNCSERSCLMTQSKVSTQSHHTSLILCIVPAVWYYLRAEILASYYNISINLQICTVSLLLLLLVTIFIYSKYFLRIVTSINNKNKKLQIYICALFSKVKLPKVTWVTMIELRFKPNTIDYTAWPLKIYLSLHLLKSWFSIKFQLML